MGSQEDGLYIRHYARGDQEFVPEAAVAKLNGVRQGRAEINNYPSPRRILITAVQGMRCRSWRRSWEVTLRFRRTIVHRDRSRRYRIAIEAFLLLLLVNDE